MNTLIPITNLFETHKISRETILAEAIEGNVQLFCIERGEPRELQPEELKSLPHPEEQFRKPSESGSSQRLNEFVQRLGHVDRHTKLLRRAKSLSVREEDLQDYLSATKIYETKKIRPVDLATVFDTIGGGDLNKSEKKTLNSLKKKYPKAIKFCALMVMAAAKVSENGGIEWKKYSRDTLEEMAASHGLPNVIGREVHKQLPDEMKGK